MKNYADEFRADLAEFRQKTEQFYRGEIPVAQYKGFSGGFGSYAQRGGQAGMLRLRLCGGRVTKHYLKFITDSIDKYKIEKIHLTTCQSIQLHNLSGETICSLIEEAWDNDIITRGGGGDYPRNVMVSPLAGVEIGEIFDVTPYANAAADYLLGFIKAVKLPRKLKVCFSNSVKNYPHATFRDLGFVTTPEGKFDVYSAGGLGRAPKFGVKVAEGIDPSEILYYIKAMVETFMAYGDYENRGKARTRFMQDKLGAEGYKEAYLEKLAEVKEKEKLTLELTTEILSKDPDGTIADERVTSQKQDGLYAVAYHPAGGDLAPAKLKELYQTIENMEDVELRITPDEGLYIINCTAKEAEKVLAVTADGAKTEFERSVACIGNSICQVGARDSQELLHLCLDAVAKENFADGVLPAIHISGCPSSCGSHQTNILGFRGGVKQTADGPKPAFALYSDGCDLQGEEKMAQELGAIVIEEIPEYLIELGKEVERNQQNFAAWFAENQETFRVITEKYTLG